MVKGEKEKMLERNLYIHNTSMNRRNFTSDNSFYTWCKGWA